jgi:translation elongation factor EF-G
MENEKGTEMNEKKESTLNAMNLSELRRVICGDMQFVITLNKEKTIEIKLKELNQKELNDIDNKLFDKGFSAQKNYKEWETVLKVLRLSAAYIDMFIDGEILQLKDENDKIIIDPTIKKEYVEKFIWTLSEGVIAGLAMQYDNVVIDKFASIQKKTILKAV